MHKLVTEQGWEFNAQSFVNIGGKYYDMDEMTPEQRNCVGALLNVQGLNGAFAGKAVFRAEGIPPLRELFPELGPA